MHINFEFSDIYDWQDFHIASFKAFGFAGYYDNNMDAWVEGVASIIDPDGEMTGLQLPHDEVLTIEVTGTEQIIQNCPEVLLGFVEGTAAVNQRFADEGIEARIALVVS